ncbi:hypothetical protein NPIL_313421 [Nephila pilipes]|uniref:Uncharacterized protein n=1 Tax=Nephila pilipes TaxID=299642 RepID=A0A8X6NT09_NEPPI|nr:hypothetical protein NPIL_323691 [Nephila pilipes]GFT30261.1 hypothetical protein NPIL_313421 [Nephila pilipes]
MNIIVNFFFCLNELVTCSNVIRVPKGLWLSELNNFGIRVTDLEINYFEIGSDVNLLTVADFTGNLLTGNIKILKSGSVAVQTNLGWTLMSRISVSKTNDWDSLMDITLLTNESFASNFCKFDIFDIADPAESKTKFEKHEQTIRFFKNTVTRGSEGKIMNARPLAYVTEDIDLLTPLAASMFLLETRSSDVEGMDAIDTQEMIKEIKHRQQVSR